MSQLIDRNRQIPNGFRFLQPETGWQSQPWASFDTIVRTLIGHRNANPYLVTKHSWATDYESVANEVDAYNTKLCEQHGWLDFITPNIIGDAGAPKLVRSRNQLGGLQAVAVGAESIAEFTKDGAPHVSHEQAEGRAAVCAVCPKNGKGDWTHYFTEPISNAIREALGFFQKHQYTTSHDAVLKVCEACNCPLPFLVHFPVETKYKRMSDEAKADLDPQCWILKEMAAKK